MTTDKQNERWFQNPWVWLVIAIPALTVAGGLLTLFLAINNPHIIVSDSATEENATTRTP